MGLYIRETDITRMPLLRFLSHVIALLLGGSLLLRSHGQGLGCALASLEHVDDKVETTRTQ
jgi:hypothetical protein